MKWWRIKHAMRYMYAFVSKQIMVSSIFKSLVLILLIASLNGCGSKAVGEETISFGKNLSQDKIFPQKLSQKISETSPPKVIQELQRKFDVYQPQVKVVSPKYDQVIGSKNVSIKFDVKDLPIFQDSELGLGSHLNVILDNGSLREVYDISQPLELSELTPGTHTLRVFAARPWNESFKNEEAYTQVKFHVFTKSEDNNPSEDLPLLTYSSPEGNYGAEPILLDFYLTNAPLHIVSGDPENEIGDWRIRCTINGESFLLDQWQSLYLKGFKKGENWIKLEFIDGQGNTVRNVFNSTLKTLNYQPKGKDTLSRIIRGELLEEQLLSIVVPKYSNTDKVVEPELSEPESESLQESQQESKSDTESNNQLEEIQPKLESETTEEEAVNTDDNQNAEKLEQKSSLEELGNSENEVNESILEQNTDLTPNNDILPISPNSETTEKSNSEDLEKMQTKLESEIEQVKKTESESDEIPQTERTGKLPNLGKYFQRRNVNEESNSKLDVKKSETQEVKPVNPETGVPETEISETEVKTILSDKSEKSKLSTPVPQIDSESESKSVTKSKLETVVEAEAEPIIKQPSDNQDSKDSTVKNLGKYFNFNRNKKVNEELDEIPEVKLDKKSNPEIQSNTKIQETLPEISNSDNSNNLEGLSEMEIQGE